MKLLLTIIVAIPALFMSCGDDNESHDHSEAIVIEKTDVMKPDTSKKSLTAYVKNKIGNANFEINYHSPALRGRTIWGGLVPYDQVWVTGAHNATSIESNRDFIIGGKEIPAGKYAFFTIPGKEKWTVIINKNWDQHLADEYKAEDDLLRVDIIPDTLQYKQERLMYDIDQSAQNEGNILMMWDSLKLVVPVRIAD